MHFERRSHWSDELDKEMFFNVYGHAEKPIIVFPSPGGSQDEYRDFGMIEACQDFINRGLVRLYTLDSYGNESRPSTWKAGHDKAFAHEAHGRYIVNELVSLTRYESNQQGGMLATGCSMGAFHAVNFALRHPDLFDVAVTLSGVYDARFFTSDYDGDLAVYYNSPIDYLWNQEDDWLLDHYRHNRFIVAVGQGAWEEPHILDTKHLEEAFAAKFILARFDFWGKDVAHDWEWWRVQMPYFLGKLEEENRL